MKSERPGGTELYVSRDWTLQHHQVDARVLEVKVKERFCRRANKTAALFIIDH